MLLAIPAVILQVLCVSILLLLIFSKENKLLSFFKNNFLILGFLFSLAATLASLFYSEVIGFIPCSLCWLQRIFMYPFVFLFGVALFKKDRGVALYLLPLVVVGILISLYHNFIYYFGGGTAPCDASGVSCVQQLVNEFGGYISIPMLSLTTFFALLTLILVSRFYKKE